MQEVEGLRNENSRLRGALDGSRKKQVEQAAQAAQAAHAAQTHTMHHMQTAVSHMSLQPGQPGDPSLYMSDLSRGNMSRMGEGDMSHSLEAVSSLLWRSVL